MDFEALFARIKAIRESLTTTQLVSLTVTFAAVVSLVAGSALWLSQPDYVVLFSDLDADSANGVVERLESGQVPYRLASGGGQVLVPRAQVDRLRIELSTLVGNGRVGFEIFDRTAFGQTEFLERVNYRRALEGEIARTIQTITEVASARVLIAPGKESLFGARQQPAKASVILKLRSSRPLPAAAIGGIRSLVAASVEGLRPEGVVIIDSYGRSLAAESGDEEPMGAQQLERQQRLERDLTTKVVSLLEPVVGIGRVRVNVSARLTSDASEQTEELWDPNAVVRSRQTSTETAPGGGAAGGVAGAPANLPPPAAATEATPGAPVVPAAPPAVATRSTETTNYEISKVVRRTSRPRGDVGRLSVAVLLDHVSTEEPGADGTIVRTSRPRDPAEMQKLQELVAAAVGLDPDRGDQLTVESIAFDETLVDAEPARPFLEKYGPQLLELGKVVAVLVLGVLAFFFFVRPIVNHTVRALPRAAGTAGAPVLMAAGGEAGGQLPRTVEELEDQIEAQLDAEVEAQTQGQDRRLPVLRRRVQKLAADQPESAARLLRALMIEEPKGRR